MCFTDDDCVPPKDWISNVVDHFKIDPTSQVVMGLGLNYYPQNLSAVLEQYNYEVWLRKIIPDLSKKTTIVNGKIVDTKITSFRKIALNNLRFSEDLQQDEDVELGTRLIEQNIKISYNPKIKTYHKNSKTFSELIHRKYFRGVSQHQLRKEKGIQIKHTHDNNIIHKLLGEKTLYKEMREKFNLSTLASKIILNFYRSTYKIGKTYAIIYYAITKKHPIIPNR